MFELATRLCCPIEELGDKLSQDELLAWRWYLSEPRGDRRNDWHAAQVSSAIYDVIKSLAGKNKVRNYPLNSFLLKFESPASKEEKRRKDMMGIIAAFGAYIPQEAKRKMLGLENDT